MQRPFNVSLPESWDGWTFEDDYLVSPQGDKYLPHLILACTFVRQMETYKIVTRADKLYLFESC